MLTAPQESLEALRKELAGRLAMPGEHEWDVARQAFNLAIDQRPEAVAFPANADDVATIVRFAREHGLRIAPQRTGHNAAPLGALEGTILLKTSEMTGVEIDAGSRRARAQAGALWGDLVPDASELGLAALHGSAPNIGIVGYSLGGGVGWYARKLGLAANSVTAVELVAADGRRLRADPENEPELFWALRGGGGNFGVVTAIEMELYPIEQVYAGALFFPLERASEVLHAWHELVAGVPEEVTSVGRMLNIPPIPEAPEFLRGKSFAVVEMACLLDEAEGAELARPLRDLGPEIDTIAMVPPAVLTELHMDPPDPVPSLGQDRLLGELPAKAIDDVVEAAGPDSGSSLLSVELRHLGGELARSSPANGALGSLEGTFLNYSVGMLADESSLAAVEPDLARVDGALAPYDAGRGYYNFVERSVDAAFLFDGETYERLRQVRSQFDPDRIFRANHEISAA
jgi:FAD/FMN-containing dehydrogenase